MGSVFNALISKTLQWTVGKGSLKPNRFAVCSLLLLYYVLVGITFFLKYYSIKRKHLLIKIQNHQSLCGRFVVYHFNAVLVVCRWFLLLKFLFCIGAARLCKSSGQRYIPLKFHSLCSWVLTAWKFLWLFLSLLFDNKTLQGQLLLLLVGVVNITLSYVGQPHTSWLLFIALYIVECFSFVNELIHLVSSSYA